MDRPKTIFDLVWNYSDTAEIRASSIKSGRKDCNTLNQRYRGAERNVLLRIYGFADVFIIGGTFLFSLSWQLTLIALSVVIPLIYATIIFRRKVRNAFRDVRFYLAKMNAFLQEHISGVQVVKIFHKEKRTIEEFKQINYDHTAANKKSVMYYSVFFPVVEFIGHYQVL
jgi:ABC-type multidrug transport system fused ATPase/permease subunit